MLRAVLSKQHPARSLKGSAELITLQGKNNLGNVHFTLDLKGILGGSRKITLLNKNNPEGKKKNLNSVKTRCIVEGEAQKSPLFWRFSGGF